MEENVYKIITGFSDKKTIYWVTKDTPMPIVYGFFNKQIANEYMVLLNNLEKQKKEENK